MVTLPIAIPSGMSWVQSLVGVVLKKKISPIMGAGGLFKPDI